MNLPSLYARVTAKRPELAASVVYSHIIDVRDGGPPIWGWFWQVSDGMGVHVHHSIAAALILARWVEALPAGYVLARLSPGFDVAPMDGGGTLMWTDRNPTPTPLEALAAFYLGETS